MDRGHDNEFFWQEGARHVHEEWWSGPFHAIAFLILLALLVVGVVWIVRRLSPGVPAATVVPVGTPAAGIAADPAVAALRMRYARGEVSREDFQHGMEDLTGTATPWPGNNPGEGTAPTAS